MASQNHDMKRLIVCFLFFATPFVFSQKNAILDSLTHCIGKGTDRAQFETLYLLSEEYSKSDLDKALHFANLSLKRAKFLENDTMVAIAYNSMANIFQYKSKFDLSLVFHQKALNARKQLRDSIGIADSYNNIGIAYDSKGQFRQALHNYFKALYYYDKKNALDKLGMVNTNIGIIYKTQKEYKKALRYYQKAYDFYLRSKEDFGITVSSGNLGSILIDFKSYESSLKYSEIAKKGYEKLGYERYVAYPICNIAVVYDSLHQFELANANYLRAIALHTKHDNIYEVANSYNAYAACLLKQKKYAESILMSENGKTNAKQADAYWLEVIANENLSKAFAGMGNYKDAFIHSRLYNKGKDSLFVVEKTKTIFELESIYETAKKEKLLIQKDAEAKKRNVLVVVLSLLFVFALVIGYLIFRQQKLKNRQQEQEFQLKAAISQIETQNQLQNQRLAISRDLHDNIGAQLTFIISSVDNIKYAFDLKNKKLDTKLERISSFTKSTITELRDTIWAMNTEQITFEDLRIRIFNLIEKAKIAKEDVDFRFQIDEQLHSLHFTSIKGMNIYRTIQEAVNNSIKYANATQISVEVQNSDDAIQITISDNGVGFDINSVTHGNGLQNMRKRLKDIGGSFQLDSTPGNGTNVIITIKKQ